jgi:opacity protein-like surface antigen
MKTIIGAAALSACFHPALCADLPAKAAYVPCTTTSCSGFYGGFNVTGAGSDLSTGTLASGGGVGLNGGYQYWDSKVYFGAEVFGDYMFQNISAGPTASVNPGYLFGQTVSLGVPFSNLFGLTPTAPGVLPTNFLASTLSPYVEVGAIERPWGAAWATGVGIAGDISTRWFWKLDYLHAVYSNITLPGGETQQKTDNLLRFGMNYKF